MRIRGSMVPVTSMKRDPRMLVNEPWAPIVIAIPIILASYLYNSIIIQIPISKIILVSMKVWYLPIISTSEASVLPRST